MTALGLLAFLGVVALLWFLVVLAIKNPATGVLVGFALAIVIASFGVEEKGA